MRYQKLSVFLLSATAFAAPQDSADQIMSDLSSLASDFPTDINIPVTAFMPPSSILTVLQTAIPTDVASSILIAPSSWASQFASSIENGQTPDWYKGLPQSVKDYFSSQSAAITSAVGTETPSATDGSSSGSSGATPTATDSSSSANPTDDAEATDSASPSEGASPTVSDNIAPRATGAVVASLAGVAGILGLALGL